VADAVACLDGELPAVPLPAVGVAPALVALDGDWLPVGVGSWV
jgi:hypothetical protein